MYSALVIFLALVWLHAIADYPLQGDFLAAAKNHRAPIVGMPATLALATHVLIHAGFVVACTGSLALGAAELVAHAAIDRAKCDGAFGILADQALHVLCKLAWTALLIYAL